MLLFLINCFTFTRDANYQTRIIYYTTAMVQFQKLLDTERFDIFHYLQKFTKCLWLYTTIANCSINTYITFKLFMESL